MAEMAEVPVLMTAKEVSELTGISISRLHAMAVQREHGLPSEGPPHLRLGSRRRRWDQADVIEFIQRSRVR